jgi:hypothetical protein
VFVARVLLVSVTVLPGVEAFPVSAAVKVSVGLVPPAPVIPDFEKEKAGEANAKVKVSDGVASELPVAV